MEILKIICFVGEHSHWSTLSITLKNLKQTNKQQLKRGGKDCLCKKRSTSIAMNLLLPRSHLTRTLKTKILKHFVVISSVQFYKRKSIKTLGKGHVKKFPLTDAKLKFISYLRLSAPAHVTCAERVAAYHNQKQRRYLHLPLERAPAYSRSFFVFRQTQNKKLKYCARVLTIFFQHTHLIHPAAAMANKVFHPS